MNSKDYLIKSFCVSVILHTFIMYGVPGFPGSALKKNKPPEVVYYKIQEKPLVKEEVNKESYPKQIKLVQKEEKPAKGGSASGGKEEAKADKPQEKESPKKQEAVNEPAKEVPQKQEIPSRKLAPDKTELVKLDEKRSFKTSPAFLTYNNYIREKIRKTAVSIYERTYEQGNIHMSFTIEKSGNLKALNVITEHSSENNYLKQIAKKSILDSSPFPPFSEELDIPEITFNILMAFRSGNVSSE